MQEIEIRCYFYDYHYSLRETLPFALQVSVTLVPSRTTMSLLVIDSTIIGGTAIKKMSFLEREM